MKTCTCSWNTGSTAVALSITLALISCCMFLSCTCVDSLVVDIELLDTTLDGIIMCGTTAGKTVQSKTSELLN